MNAPVPEDLDLGWSLAAVFGAYLELGNAAFNEIPGGPRGYQVLRSIDAGEPASQLDLARRVGLDRTVMTYLIDDLEAAGLVQRRVDPADRRARRIELTDKAHTLLPDLNDRLAEIERTVLKALDDNDAATLRRLLRSAAAAYRDSAGDPARLARQIRGGPRPRRNGT